MNESNAPEIGHFLDTISKVEFKHGKREPKQYTSPIQRILRDHGLETMLEYRTTYPEWHALRTGYIDVYAKKGNTIIGIEIDYKTPKKNSILKVSRIFGATPVFMLTYERDPDIKESLEKVNLPHFYLIDIYNQKVYSQKDKENMIGTTG